MGGSRLPAGRCGGGAEAGGLSAAVPAAELLANGCHLDLKNPHAKQDLEHLPPEELAESILQKELRIAEIMREIKAVLEVGV